MLNGISNILYEGGYYITSLKEGIVNRGGEISPELKQSFLHKAKERYQLYSSILPNVDIDDIITTYINNMSSYPAENLDSIIELFNSSGFQVVFYESGDVEGEYEASKYYRIIAKKS